LHLCAELFANDQRFLNVAFPGLGVEKLAGFLEASTKFVDQKLVDGKTEISTGLVLPLEPKQEAVTANDLKIFV
jgi:hypothetical protein